MSKAKLFSWFVTMFAIWLFGVMRLMHGEVVALEKVGSTADFGMSCVELAVAAMLAFVLFPREET